MKPTTDTFEHGSRAKLAFTAAALGLLLGACSGPAPEAAEGTVAATAPAPEATADTATEEPSAPPPADERPRPPDDADPLVIAEYYFEPEVWAAVHRPPDRVPDEVLAALGKELPKEERGHCQSSNRPDCRLRIVSPPYAFYRIPYDALRTKKSEEISASDFEISHWGFPRSYFPQETWSRMFSVWSRDGRWTSSCSEDMGFPTKNFLVFENKHALGATPIQRRGIGTHGLDANYLIVIQGNGTLEDGHFYFIDPMWDKRRPENKHKYIRDINTPVDEPIGFRNFVKHLKKEIKELDEKEAKVKGQSKKPQAISTDQEGAE